MIFSIGGLGLAMVGFSFVYADIHEAEGVNGLQVSSIEREGEGRYMAEKNTPVQYLGLYLGFAYI